MRDQRLSRDSVKPGVYRHFKGRMYHVLGVAADTESGNLSVVYIPQDGDYASELFYRSLQMFLEEVDRPDFHYKGPRFLLIEEREFV